MNIFVRREAHVVLFMHTYFQPPKSPVAIKLGLTSAPIVSQATLISTYLLSVLEFYIFTF